MNPFSFTTRQYRWLALFWTLGLVVAFSLPPDSLAAPPPALSVDKLVHVGLFSGFAALWMRALCPPTATWEEIRRKAGHLVVWGGLFAAGSEVYQHLLPIRRVGDPYDALADGVGLLVGLLSYAGYVRWAGRRADTPQPR